jgi:hypothetical protein
MEKNKALNTYGLPITSATASGDTATISFSQAEYSNLYAISGEVFIVPQHVWSAQSDPAQWTDPSPGRHRAVRARPLRAAGLHAQVEQELLAGRAEGHRRSASRRTPRTPRPTRPWRTGRSTGPATTSPTSDHVRRPDKADNHYWFPATNTVILVYNVTEAPFNDVAVRKAVSDAIDRSQLSSVGEEGYEAPATSDSGLLLPNFNSQVPSNLANDISASSNTSAVTSVMTTAGYALDSNKIWAKGGKEVTFTIEDPSSYTDYYEDANLIKSQLGPLGFNVSVNGVTPNKWAADTGRRRVPGHDPLGHRRPDPVHPVRLVAGLHHLGPDRPGRQRRPRPLQQPDRPGRAQELGLDEQPDPDHHGPRTPWPTPWPPTFRTPCCSTERAGTSTAPRSSPAGRRQTNSYNDPRPNDPFLEVTILHLTPVS